MITYKRAEINDARTLAKLRCEFLMDANNIDEKDKSKIEEACFDYFLQALENQSFVAWLAYDKNEAVATSGICFYSVPPNKKCPNGKTSYIQNMYTKKEYRRKGISKSLFSKMLDEASSRECTKIGLTATDMGRPLYEKFGFKDQENSMVYYLDIKSSPVY
jgi:GNAT superfamily N-acetyltransferase